MMSSKPGELAERGGKLLAAPKAKSKATALAGQYNFMVTFLLFRGVVLGNIIVVIFMAITVIAIATAIAIANASWAGVESLAGIKFKCYGPCVPPYTCIHKCNNKFFGGEECRWSRPHLWLAAPQIAHAPPGLQVPTGAVGRLSANVLIKYSICLNQKTRNARS